MFKILKSSYCLTTVKLGNKLISTECKVKRNELLNNFLKECLNKLVCPKWIIARIYKSRLKYSYKVEKIFLKLEIRKIEERLINLKDSAVSIKNSLKIKLKEEHFNEFISYSENITKKQQEKYLAKNKKNLNRLVELKFGNFTKQSVKNLSSQKFDEKDLTALSYGMNFSLPAKKVDQVATYLGFEKYLNQLLKLQPSSKQDEVALKANLVSVAHNFCKLKPEHSSVINSKEIISSLTKIKSNEHIVITKPDKGSGIVILNKEDYNSKMLNIINDEKKFLKIGPVGDNLTIVKLEKKIIQILKDLVDKNELSQEHYNLIRPVGSIRPRLYGLPKLHKVDIPLRPILSMIRSPQHELARYLNSLLDPVLKYFSRYIVKDSFKFVDDLKLQGAKDTFLCSFDVKSLFTSVPLNEVIDICAEMLYNLENPTLKRSNFVRLMRLATEEVEFSFNNILYRQIDGIAMGSPLGPTLANIFMGYLEYKVLPEFDSNCKYMRYVDDCFVISDSVKVSNLLFERLNSLHSAIKFTKENEENDQISFLDVLIKRKDNKFITSIFRKPFTGQYLNFQSYCSKRRKIGLIKTLFHRANKICSPEVFQNELKVIKELLIKNGYPNPLIDRVFKTELRRLKYTKPYGPEKCPVLLILPYVGEKSKQVERDIKNMTEKVYHASKPRVIFTSAAILNPRGKDLISYKHKSCVVYTYKCCCANSYIGQTSRHLETRIKEHVPKCVKDHIKNQPKKMSNATLNATKRSSISEHLVKNPKCGNNYSETKFKVLRSCTNIFDLIKIEAIYIHLDKPELCKQREFDYSLSLFKLD